VARKTASIGINALITRDAARRRALARHNASRWLASASANMAGMTDGGERIMAEERAGGSDGGAGANCAAKTAPNARAAMACCHQRRRALHLRTRAASPLLCSGFTVRARRVRRNISLLPAAFKTAGVPSSAPLCHLFLLNYFYDA